ncbi:MAG TPA: hypothetical protein VGK15_00590 [Candidatus Limnocylindria bacterium]|jgi:hypothetical protein
MIASARVAVFGTDDLRACVLALGFEPADAAQAALAVIDTREAEALSRASSIPLTVPRVFIASAAQRGLMDALGIDPARVAESCDPVLLGPVVMSALPVRRRSATRVAVVTSVRGGVGRTLLAANLAVRIAPRMRVCVIDATGTGAVGWWLNTQARPWSSLEGLVDELSADQLSVLAEDAGPGLRVVGGPPIAPSDALLTAATRAATALDDLVIIDAPIAADQRAHRALANADRVMLVAYDDPLSVAAIEALSPSEDVWLIASQLRIPRLGARDVFRALPRDESAVGAALGNRERIRGQLGRAYDDLAELLLIDAS